MQSGGSVPAVPPVKVIDIVLQAAPEMEAWQGWLRTLLRIGGLEIRVYATPHDHKAWGLDNLRAYEEFMTRQRAAVAPLPASGAEDVAAE